VLDQPFERFPCKVQPVEFGITAFERRDDPERLGIVVEAAIGPHPAIERPLTGMAKGRMAEIVNQRDRLGQILIEPQRPGKGAGDLRYLDRMGQPRAEMVALIGDENLRLVAQPTKRRGVDDSVAVPLVGCTGGA